MKEFKELVGRTINLITQDGDGIVIELDGGLKCRLYHEQDCCESVDVHSIDGTFDSIVGQPLIEATEEVDTTSPPPESEYRPESYTWTVYTLATQSGRVVIRWFGESNGYYSEDVRFAVLP